MKMITFIRHAKSSWEHDVSDRERPLKQRGINDSHLVSKYFKKANYIPDTILTSPAKRAKKTCEIFVENLDLLGVELRIVEDVYDFGGRQLINFISSLDNRLNKIMIFGHNHALTSIANSYGSKYIDNVPTCGLIQISFDINEWNNIMQGETLLTIFPRDLK